MLRFIDSLCFALLRLIKTFTQVDYARPCLSSVSDNDSEDFSVNVHESKESELVSSTALDPRTSQESIKDHNISHKSSQTYSDISYTNSVVERESFELEGLDSDDSASILIMEEAHPTENGMVCRENGKPKKVSFNKGSGNGAENGTGSNSPDMHDAPDRESCGRGKFEECKRECTRWKWKVCEYREKENKTLRVQLEKALRSLQFLEFQLNERNGELTSMTENLRETEEAQKREKELNIKEHELNESRNMLANAKIKIDQLNEENDLKTKTIDELHKRLSEAFEASLTGSHHENGVETTGDQDKISKFEAEISRLEQRLKDVLEEKEYYKKHHQSNNAPAFNGSQSNGNMNDEFGRELMMANKRKYQLENRMKQLEHELKESHSIQQTVERNLKNSEKLLWLEKERSATLEGELHMLRRDLDEQRRLNEELNAELDRYHLRDGDEALNTSAVLLQNTALRKEGGGEQFVKEVENLQKDYDIKLHDLLQMKNKAEWNLGEMTQSWHDAKWRVGELEAMVTQKDSEIQKLLNRVKQLEAGFLGNTTTSTLDDESQRLQIEIAQLVDEKNKIQWRLGEVTQFWNDAKWRIGELEGEVRHNNGLLEDAYRRMSELENWSCSNEIDSLRNEKGTLEWRLDELNKALNDSKWRIGELEAEINRRSGSPEVMQKLNNEIQSLRRSLDETREQKNKVEWRLGEVTQYWNNTKWRTGELQELITHRDHEISHLKSILGNEHQKSTCSQAKSTKLDSSFVIRKQPHADRDKWDNMILWENTVEKDVQLRRIWFEVDAIDEFEEVFLIGSFVNWECAIRCEILADDAKRRGVWIELTPGRHEFRFIRGGKWHTADNYAQWRNEFGDSNNWRHVD